MKYTTSNSQIKGREQQMVFVKLKGVTDTIMIGGMRVVLPWLQGPVFPSSLRLSSNQEV